jgi:hypothetical protein
MPDTTVSLLYNFLSQNGGKLSKRAQEKEFQALSQAQIDTIELLYARLFIA